MQTERVTCPSCGLTMLANPYGEPCYDCMHPYVPREVGDYTDGQGNDYGWQDTVFPNEY